MAKYTLRAKCDVGRRISLGNSPNLHELPRGPCRISVKSGYGETGRLAAGDGLSQVNVCLAVLRRASVPARRKGRVLSSRARRVICERISRAV